MKNFKSRVVFVNESYERYYLQITPKLAHKLEALGVSIKEFNDKHYVNAHISESELTPEKYIAYDAMLLVTDWTFKNKTGVKLTAYLGAISEQQDSYEPEKQKTMSKEQMQDMYNKCVFV